MENKTKQEETVWKGRTTYEKVLMIIGMACAFGVVIFGVLDLFEVIENGLAFSKIMLGVLMAVQGLMNVKRSKAVSAISFVSAALIFAVAVFILTR